VTIDGIRIPLVLYFVVGQPEDTGPPFGINDPGVKLPSFIRELMQPHVPLKRVELCMVCAADIFGVELVTAQTDPMHSAEQQAESAQEAMVTLQDNTLDAVTKDSTVLARSLLAVKVGRGAVPAPPLPPPAPVPEVEPVATPIPIATA